MTTERLYHRDAYHMRFSATVLDCRQEGDQWVAVLDRTAFYPTSGGQPHDTGTLGGRRVLAVELDEGSGAIAHRLDGPVSGTVTGEVDRARRLDHMEQHTAQHLLSAAFLRTIGAETVGFHLGAGGTTIDLAIDRLEPEAAAETEQLANRVVREDRPVRAHLVASPEEAMARFRLRKPPAVTGPVRVVEIAGFDWSPCGGTHVASTGRLGLIRIKTWERHKQGVRLTFLAGGRAEADYRRLDSAIRDLARSLSLAPDDLPQAVRRWRDENALLRRRLRDASDRLLAAEARELLAAARTVAGVRVVRHAFQGRPVEEVRSLAARVAAEPAAVALFGTRGAAPQLIFARSAGVRVDVAAVLRQVLPAIDGRGGGSPASAQGGGANPDGLGTALDVAVAQVVRMLSAPSSVNL